MFHDAFAVLRRGTGGQLPGSSAPSRGNLGPFLPMSKSSNESSATEAGCSKKTPCQCSPEWNFHHSSQNGTGERWFASQELQLNTRSSFRICGGPLQAASKHPHMQSGFGIVASSKLWEACAKARAGGAQCLHLVYDHSAQVRAWLVECQAPVHIRLYQARP